MARILVVDDDPLLRRTLRSVLERAGYVVDEAADGALALQAVAAHKPDLVLTDIVMPNREGVETIGELRKMDAKLPIIAMSGGGSVGGQFFLTLAAQFGATATLTKPIRQADLLGAVGSCLKAP